MKHVNNNLLTTITYFCLATNISNLSCTGDSGPPPFEVAASSTDEEPDKEGDSENTAPSNDTEELDSQSGEKPEDTDSLPLDDSDTVEDSDRGEDTDSESEIVLDPGEEDENFGLKCDGTLCPSVTSPATQCCTRERDVTKRRAVNEKRCGISFNDIAGCIELEQMGVLDDSCESYLPKWASTMEPGCCTNNGKCGSFSVAEGIGCHENQSIDMSCGEAKIDKTEECDPTGIYAIRAEVDVAWGGQGGALMAITDDGRGKIKVALRITIEALNADNSIIAHVEPCHVEIPRITNSLLCESYVPTFPDEIWESGKIQEIPIDASFNCLNPGCILTVQPTTASIGIQLEDEGSLWPTAAEATTVECLYGTGKQCYPDQDGDGNPGITVVMHNGSQAGSGACIQGFDQRAAPLNANIGAIFDGVYRTNRLHLGVRVRLGMSGQFMDDCSLTDSVGFADFFQSRAVSCLLEPGTHNLFSTPAGENQLCTEQELLFMNEALPDYDILGMGERPSTRLDIADRRASEGPRFQLVRIADVGTAVSCEDVRNAF